VRLVLPPLPVRPVILAQPARLGLAGLPGLLARLAIQARLVRGLQALLGIPGRLVLRLPRVPRGRLVTRAILGQLVIPVIRAILARLDIPGLLGHRGSLGKLARLVILGILAIPGQRLLGQPVTRGIPGRPGRPGQQVVLGLRLLVLQGTPAILGTPGPPVIQVAQAQRAQRAILGQTLLLPAQQATRATPETLGQKLPVRLVPPVLLGPPERQGPLGRPERQGLRGLRGQPGTPEIPARQG
jgi:hypothetical protein